MTMTALRTLFAALVAAGAIGTAQAQGVRPEVGKPLQQASDLLKAGKAREALAKVREADAIAGKSASEQLMIDRMKGAAAQRAGDSATAIASFESAFPKLSGAEAAQVAESIAFAYSQQKNNAKASEWLEDRTRIPAVMLPLTVGGSEGAQDLFSLFDDLIDRLLETQRGAGV